MEISPPERTNKIIKSNSAVILEESPNSHFSRQKESPNPNFSQQKESPPNPKFSHQGSDIYKPDSFLSDYLESRKVNPQRVKYNAETGMVTNTYDYNKNVRNYLAMQRETRVKTEMNMKEEG